MTDYGTDINSEWDLTDDGDIQIISNTGNLDQAITNRLTCGLDSLDLFYQDYGCNLAQFLGWRKTERTLEFIKLELQNRLNNEPRILGYSLNVEYTETGVRVDMELTLNDDYTHNIQLEFNNEGGLNSN